MENTPFIRAVTTTQSDLLENVAIVFEKHAKFNSTLFGTSASIWPYFRYLTKAIEREWSEASLYVRLLSINGILQ